MKREFKSNDSDVCWYSLLLLCSNLCMGNHNDDALTVEQNALVDVMWLSAARLDRQPQWQRQEKKECEREREAESVEGIDSIQTNENILFSFFQSIVFVLDKKKKKRWQPLVTWHGAALFVVVIASSVSFHIVFLPLLFASNDRILCRQFIIILIKKRLYNFAAARLCGCAQLVDCYSLSSSLSHTRNMVFQRLTKNWMVMIATCNV